MTVTHFSKRVRIAPAQIGCLAVCMLLAACGQGPNKAGRAGQPQSPFAHLLPKDPPDEKYRVVHPAGYSIVYPAGWKTQVQHFPDAHHVDGLNTDDRGRLGSEDSSKPSLYILRFSAEGNLHVQAQKRAGQADGYFSGKKEVLFQNQPAWAGFDAGRLPDKVSMDNLFQDSRAGYPYLTQEILFERNGEWFTLTFHMRNIDGRKGPFFTEAVPVIQEYFETFKYEPAGKN